MHHENRKPEKTMSAPAGDASAPADDPLARLAAQTAGELDPETEALLERELADAYRADELAATDPAVHRIAEKIQAKLAPAEG